MNRLLAALALVFVVSSSTTFAGPGRVIGWGNNELGQATFWNDPPFGATAIAAGGAGGLALMSNSSVIGWGDTTYSQDKPPLFVTNVIAVSMGTYHGLALVSNGTVVAWGNGGDGRTSPPGGLTNVIRIAAGGEHSLALRSDGVIVGWGKNNNGQASPPGFTNFTEIAAGDKFSVGLRSDGSLVAWGDNSNGQTAPSPSITGVVNIAAGERHGLALLGHETREKAQHKPQMVVGLAVQPLDLKAVAAVGSPYGDDVLAEHVAVGFHVEGFQARRLGRTQTDE